jgi:hypothetical protein
MLRGLRRGLAPMPRWLRAAAASTTGWLQALALGLGLLWGHSAWLLREPVRPQPRC